MNVQRIRAENFRSYDEFDVTLPQGALAVVGTNGAGKSSLVEAIPLALFGPEGRSFSPYLSDDAHESSLVLEVEFEHVGIDYRIRRSFSPRGRGQTKVDFEARTNSSWEPRTLETAAATQNEIERVIGLNRDTFLSSAFLSQGRGDAFTSAQPRERKAILAEVLGLGTWERLLEACRTDKRSTEREASELAGRISLLEESGGDVHALEDARDDAQSAVKLYELDHANAERHLTEAAEKVAGLERAEQTYVARTSNVQSADARLRERQAVVDRAAAAKLEAVEVQRELSEAGSPSARLAELEERRVAMAQQILDRRHADDERQSFLAEHEREIAQVERFRATVAEWETKIVALREQEAAYTQSEHPICRECGQTIEGEHFTRAAINLDNDLGGAIHTRDWHKRLLEKAETSASEAKAAAEAIVLPDAPTDGEQAVLAAEIREARDAELALATLRQKLASLAIQIEEVTPELTAEVARLAGELVDAQEALAVIEEPDPGVLAAAKEAATHARRALDVAAIQLTDARAALVRAEAALEAAQKVALELDRARGRERELQGELDLLALLERAYGRDGIPALIVEASAIPQIESEADRILAELGTSYRVELRTQKALKSGDGLADTLDVVVIGEAGDRPYETFSGGERTRINLALRISLARLLAHRRGAESRLLCIDEPEFLDEAGTARLAEVLQGLGADFDKVVLVSHMPTLRDAFDQTITVEKIDGRSVIAA